jgi:hypothetical protein
VTPAWVLVAAAVAALLLLAPVIFRAWLDRLLAARRARTEELVARARRASATPGEARVDVEKSSVLDEGPLR